MTMPSPQILRVLLWEFLAWRRSPRVPEPDLVMDDPEKVAAYVSASGEDGPRAPVYLFNCAQISDVIRPGDLVLDLACGPLNQLAIVARLNPEARFVGIDLSDAMLEIAREKIDRMTLGNVTVRQGDVTRLEFRDQSVDAVVSTVSIHHLADAGELDRLFAEIDRVLKPGGGLFLEDFGHLRSERSIRYFAHQYAHLQPELYVLDYLYSLRAAFPVSDLRAAYERHLSRRARFYRMLPFPYLVVIRSDSRRGSDPDLREKILAGRSQLSASSRKDLSGLVLSFRLAGLDALGLDRGRAARSFEPA